MSLVFGYGSLMNMMSAEKTLDRVIHQGDFTSAVLHGYSRSWTAPSCIRLQQECGKFLPCDGLFLDLSSSQNTQCNGVVVEVNETELARLDVREHGYVRSVVELELECGSLCEGFTYMMPEEAKQHEGIIPARYIRMIDEALKSFPASFADTFWETTQKSDAPVIEGEYEFENCAQNNAAGRVLTDTKNNLGHA